MKDIIVLNDKKYKIIDNYGNCIKIEEIESFLDRMGRKGKISKSDYDIAAYLFVSRGGETGYISANTVEDYRKSIHHLKIDYLYKLMLLKKIIR